MATQYATHGFLVLRGVLPPPLVDAMAARVNAYIAGRGQYCRPYDSGYLLAGIERDPELAPVLDWVRTSPRLHAALQRVWHGGGAKRAGTTYRFISRSEVSVNRPRNWHLDHFGYESFAPKRTVHALLNVGVYLQDHSETVALRVRPGSHARAANGPHCLARASRGPERAPEQSLHPAKGDAVIWAFSLWHASGNTPTRSPNESTVPVAHRSLLT
eukprot:4277304-Prymnesium_polylepis.1